jgi:Dyp-type peroxidase family
LTLASHHEKNKEYWDVQGNILRGFNKPNVRLLLFQFGEGEETAKTTRKWLKSLAVWIPNTYRLKASSHELQSSLKEDPSYQLQEVWLHISLSYSGIHNLGLPNVYSKGVYDGRGKNAKVRNPDKSFRDAIDENISDDPFILGMKARAADLGDVDTNSFENWDEPYRTKDIDAIFIIAGDQDSDVNLFASQLVAEGTRIGNVCVGMEIGTALYNEQGKQIEHFGFRDGISQPLIKGVDDYARKVYVDEFDPEDFILFGLKDDEVTGHKLSWANHGSFLVFRKLQQDVTDFWEFMISASTNRKIEYCENKEYDPDKYVSPEALAAKFVGRWKSGAPLAEFEHYDPVIPELSGGNDFLYCHKSTKNPRLDDPNGKLTPIFSHIRVVNSRDDDIRGGTAAPAENRSANDMHRILRRGIPYGPTWSRDSETKHQHPRGMLFLCYQRDIERQFEYIQTHWWTINHQYKDAAHKCIVDLLNVGVDRRPFHMGLERWVATKGGGYFFSPSIHALENLEDYVIRKA